MSPGFAAWTRSPQYHINENNKNLRQSIMAYTDVYFKCIWDNCEHIWDFAVNNFNTENHSTFLSKIELTSCPNTEMCMCYSTKIFKRWLKYNIENYFWCVTVSHNCHIWDHTFDKSSGWLNRNSQLSGNYRG